MRKRPARRVKNQHSNAFGIALFIGSLIGLLIIVALGIKVFLIFHHSVFDGKHQFVLALKKPQDTQFLIFNPDANTIQSVIVTGSSPKNPESTFYVPVDATAVTTDTTASISDITNSLFLHRHQMRAQITIFDSLRLLFLLHSVDSKNETTKIFSASDFTQQETAGTNLFIDQTVYKEGESVAIINATNVSGLGTKIASLLNRMGANVISITSAEDPIPSSSVGYTGTFSYTPSRIANVLHMPLIHLSGVQISDITVTVGEDATRFFEQ